MGRVSKANVVVILLAEHERGRLDQLVSAIGALGYAVTVVADAHALVWNLKQTKVKLVVLNPTLPGLIPGVAAVVAQLRQRWSMQELPILLSHQEPMGIPGVNDHLAVPLDPANLESRLEHHLNMKREYDALCGHLAHGQQLMERTMIGVDAMDATHPDEDLQEPEGTEADAAQPAELPYVALPPDLARQNDLTATLPGIPDDAPLIFRQDVPTEDVSTAVRVKVYDTTGNHTTDPNVYQTNTDPDKHIPCELPLHLELGEHRVFCKSIWFARREILLLTFDELPPNQTVKVTLYDKQGGNVMLACRETHRREVDRDAEGVAKLHLEILDVSDNYERFFDRLRSAAKIAQTGDHQTDERATIMLKKQANAQAAATAELSAHLLSGRRYAYKQRLGRGTFASVYLVRDQALKRDVAMKVLSPSFAKNKKARLNFIEEARIAAQFHHPNIVFVYEVGEIPAGQFARHLDFPRELLDEYPERFIYFTMQYVEGETLRQRLYGRRGQKPEFVAGVMKQVAEAMDYAHKKGIIHRDIKPENIMVTSDNRALVADFGIAAPIIEQTQRKRGPRTSCTPKYASPEQLEGGAMDQRTDLYSLGISAYEALSGVPPYQGRNVEQLAWQHLNESPDPIGADTRLEAIIEKLMHKEPRGRYKDASELLADLKRYSGGEAKAKSSDLRETLNQMASELINTRDRVKAGRILSRLTSFLNLHKTEEDGAQIQEIKQKLGDPNFVNHLLEHFLTNENQPHLLRFFSELATTRVVSPLLSWFVRLRDGLKKQWLAEMALVSAGRDIMPLVAFGLELPDDEAVILLKRFGERRLQTRETIYLRWSLHRGYQTQMELLNIVRELKGRETEILNLLNLMANGDAAAHPKVARYAENLLERRLILQG